MSSFNQASAPTAARKGWFRRNWLWFVPLMIVLVVLVGAWIVWRGLYSLRSSEPYRTALAEVQKDPRVIERLGQPVEEVGWPPPSGSAPERDGGGSANLVFGVKGPKGEAQVRTEARRTRGQWETTLLDVTFADQTRITIEVGGGEEAPPFSPQGGGQAPKFAPKPGGEPSATKLPPSPTPDIHLDLPDLGPAEKGK